MPDTHPLAEAFSRLIADDYGCIEIRSVRRVADLETMAKALLPDGPEPVAVGKDFVGDVWVVTEHWGIRHRRQRDGRQYHQDPKSNQSISPSCTAYRTWEDATLAVWHNEFRKYQQKASQFRSAMAAAKGT